MWKKNEKKLFYDGNKYLLDKIPEDKDYFIFLREMHDNNKYRQVVISSRIMLEILKEKFSTSKATIKKIQLQRNDEEYQNILDDLIEDVRVDRDNFVNLIDEIHSLNSDDSIDIRFIDYNIRNEDGVIETTISNNGIIRFETYDVKDDDSNLSLLSKQDESLLNLIAKCKEENASDV